MNILLTVTQVILATAIGAGVLVSLAFDKRLPPVEIDHAVQTHMVDLQERVKKGDAESTIAELELASQVLVEDRDVALNMLGQAYAESGRAEDAVFALERAIAARPDNPASYSNLAVVYARAGLFSRARAAVAEALRLDPENEAAKQTAKALEQVRQGSQQVDRERAAQIAKENEFVFEVGREAVQLLYNNELRRLHDKFDHAYAKELSFETLSHIYADLKYIAGAEVEIIAEDALRGDSGERVYFRRARFDSQDAVYDLVVEVGLDREIEKFWIGGVERKIRYDPQ